MHMQQQAVRKEISKQRKFNIAFVNASNYTFIEFRTSILYGIQQRFIKIKREYELF